MITNVPHTHPLTCTFTHSLELFLGSRRTGVKCLWAAGPVGEGLPVSLLYSWDLHARMSSTRDTQRLTAGRSQRYSPTRTTL